MIFSRSCSLYIKNRIFEAVLHADPKLTLPEMANTPCFLPTAGNAYVITYPEGTDAAYDFAAILDQSRNCERHGDIERACNLRYDAVKKLVDLIPDEDEVQLDWDEEDNHPVLELLKRSAIDHFLVGDFEMAAGLMEMLLDLDPEDHLEATTPLAFSYVALEEYELFGEVINDISDKYPEKEILKLWSEFRQTGKLPQGELIHFKKSFPIFYAEFIANHHEITPEYLSDIESEKPTRQTLARELWLQTEHLWHLFPGFIEALSTH